MRSRTGTVGLNVVSGTEASFRASTDAGSLLGKSPSIRGVAAQQRNPVNTDVRVRGSRTGQVGASGSYWVPARIDLDTMLSKLDSGIIEDIVVINGPYSAQHGPGFNFLDVNLRPSPRSKNGLDSGGKSSIEYKTNGEQWYGRQTLWLADVDYGLRVSYGHRTGNDYSVGGKRDLMIAPEFLSEPAPGSSSVAEIVLPGVDLSRFDPIDGTIPSSYKSRDLEAVFGFDPTENSRFEFAYLRLGQTDVEFPGLVFDINYLVTDAWEATWQLVDQPGFDELTIHSWHNNTRFNGDTFSPAKNRHIPSLEFVLLPQRGKGAAFTSVRQSSSGFQSSVGVEANGTCVVAGIDLRYLTQDLNDFEALDSGGFNFPIANAWSVNPGVYFEAASGSEDSLKLTFGGRLDFVGTSADDMADRMFLLIPGMPIEPGSTSQVLDARLNQEFLLGSAFLKVEQALVQSVTLSTGFGFAQRPPNLTEMYANGSFIGSLQPGLTFVAGDPNLNPEELLQIDVGLSGDWDAFRFSANGFFAWIDNYITYDADYIGTFSESEGFHFDGQLPQVAQYTNTQLATLAGFELSSELEFTSFMTGFASVEYVEGWDRTRARPARRLRASPPRSGFFSSDVQPDLEPLPGIPPLTSKLGVRLHEPRPDPDWTVELSARVVDDQNKVARSLLERPTPGFSVWDVRTFWRMTPNWTILAGVENFTDKFYREHLDFRTGYGVYRPGISFYGSTEVTW